MIPCRMSEHVSRNWPDVAKKIDSEEAISRTVLKEDKNSSAVFYPL